MFRLPQLLLRHLQLSGRLLHLHHSRVPFLGQQIAGIMTYAVGQVAVALTRPLVEIAAQSQRMAIVQLITSAPPVIATQARVSANKDWVTIV